MYKLIISLADNTKVEMQSKSLDHARARARLILAEGVHSGENDKSETFIPVYQIIKIKIVEDK